MFVSTIGALLTGGFLYAASRKVSAESRMYGFSLKKIIQVGSTSLLAAVAGHQLTKEDDNAVKKALFSVGGGLAGGLLLHLGVPRLGDCAVSYNILTGENKGAFFDWSALLISGLSSSVGLFRYCDSLDKKRKEEEKISSPEEVLLKEIGNDFLLQKTSLELKNGKNSNKKSSISVENSDLRNKSGGEESDYSYNFFDQQEKSPLDKESLVPYNLDLSLEKLKEQLSGESLENLKEQAENRDTDVFANFFD